MKRIALITYHDADNYGATMQAYATYKVLLELGHEVEFVDLKIEEPNPLLKKIALSLKHYRFSSFRKKYFNSKTRRYKSVEDLQNDPPKADVYIVGSDQTWNLDISKDKARAFFLDFGKDETKRFSYASSFGKEVCEDSKWMTIKEVKNLLSRFNAISIREKTGVTLCRELFNIEAIQVLDPVLLHEDYKEITGEIIPMSDEIVAYKLLDDPLFYDLAKKLSNHYSAPIRSIGTIRQISGVKSKYSETIPDWIKAIAGAKFMFTDSFHGVVLSLLYKKQFVVFVGNQKLVTRIRSLLELVGLENRICSTKDNIESVKSILAEPINYDRVSKELVKLRNESLEFLKQI